MPSRSLDKETKWFTKTTLTESEFTRPRLSTYPQLPFANTANYYLSAQSTSKDPQREFERKENEFPTDAYKSSEELHLSFDEDDKENVANIISQIFSSINRLADKAHYSFTAVFTLESQRESSLEDSEEAKMKSDDKDGHKMSC